MPLPVAALPPAAACYASAAAAAKHLALHGGPFVDLTTLSSASFAGLVLRYYWKNKVPAWAKEDISFKSLLRRKRQGNEGEEKELLTPSEREEREMANLSSVLEKLRAMVEFVQFDDDHPSAFQLYVALLAYIQLWAQIKHQQQEECTNDCSEEKNCDSRETHWSFRDSLYRNANPSAATRANVPADYYNFVENPSTSPVQKTLQQALVYATWAYYDNTDVLEEKLAAQDFSLLEHSKESRPGHVAYYMAVSSSKIKQIIIGVRGTSTLEDMVTDCCGRPVPFDDRPYYYSVDRGTKRNRANNNHDPARIEVKAATPLQIIPNDDAYHVEVISGHERIWVETESESDTYLGDHLLHCHEGVMVSARRLVDKLQDKIEYWVLQCDYQLLLCGHSLGAGAATLAAVILRSRLPEMTIDADKVRVFAFAPPPVLDHHSAIMASSFCTSIVNNADIIPRCSLSNLAILLEILRTIYDKLKEKDLAPTGAKSMAAFVQKIKQGLDGDMLMTTKQLREAMFQAMTKVQTNQTQNKVGKERGCETDGDFSCFLCGGGNIPLSTSIDSSDGNFGETVSSSIEESVQCRPVGLFIPGIVMLANEQWHSPAEEVGENGDFLQGDKGKDEQEKRVETHQGFQWSVADAGADVLRFLEFDNFTFRMLTDHSTTSYYTLLDLKYEF